MGVYRRPSPPEPEPELTYDEHIARYYAALASLDEAGEKLRAMNERVRKLVEPSEEPAPESKP